MCGARVTHQAFASRPSVWLIKFSIKVFGFEILRPGSLVLISADSSRESCLWFSFYSAEDYLLDVVIRIGEGQDSMLCLCGEEH